MPESLLVGEFESVVAGLRAKDHKLTREAALAAAEAYVRECGCELIEVERNGSRIKLVVTSPARRSR